MIIKLQTSGLKNAKQMRIDKRKPNINIHEYPDPWSLKKKEKMPEMRSWKMGLSATLHRIITEDEDL